MNKKTSLCVTEVSRDPSTVGAEICPCPTWCLKANRTHGQSFEQNVFPSGKRVTLCLCTKKGKKEEVGRAKGSGGILSICHHFTFILLVI